MIALRPSAQRGHFDHGWLDTYHSFSFADYYDPAQMGFRSLRVINEDRVEPGQGFGMHPHNDMEIVTVILEGALQHKDSMGNGSIIRPGDVQRMSAGTGVLHSEFNPSDTEPVHLLQIWIRPNRNGLAPSYEQKTFETKPGRLTLVASPDARDGSVKIHQDAELYRATLESGQSVTHALQPGRGAWIQVARGTVRLAEQTLSAGDGAALEDVRRIDLAATELAEILLFDLA
jgi:hypothetical protein